KRQWREAERGSWWLNRCEEMADRGTAIITAAKAAGYCCDQENSLMSLPANSDECPPPLVIERLPAEHSLRLAWPDGREAKLPLVELRGQCMCARCVDEITGK